MTENLKHISQLTPTDRARVDEQMRMALLTIVASQGKSIHIPIDDADAIWESHILKLQVIEINGVRLIELAAERVQPLIIQASANDLPA